MCLSIGLYLRCEILYKTCFSGQLRMASSESDTVFAMAASNVAGDTTFGISFLEWTAIQGCHHPDGNSFPTVANS